MDNDIKEQMEEYARDNLSMLQHYEDTVDHYDYYVENMIERVPWIIDVGCGKEFRYVIVAKSEEEAIRIVYGHWATPDENVPLDIMKEMCTIIGRGWAKEGPI